MVSSFSEWNATLSERVAKLNSSPASHVFEVQASQTLVVFGLGDWEGDVQALIEGRESTPPPGMISNVGIISDVKPGLWALSLDEEPPYTATWVSDGHIDYDTLPQVPLVSSLDLDNLEWENVLSGFYDPDTSGCVLALEAAQELLEVGLVDALVSFIGHACSEVAVPGGFFFGPADRNRAVYIGVQNNQVVQVKVCWDDGSDDEL